jgi:hypothetical protein
MNAPPEDPLAVAARDFRIELACVLCRCHSHRFQRNCSPWVTSSLRIRGAFARPDHPPVGAFTGGRSRWVPSGRKMRSSFPGCGTIKPERPPADGALELAVAEADAART